MKSTLWTLATLISIANAHLDGIAGLPQLMGARRFLSGMKSQNTGQNTRVLPTLIEPDPPNIIKERQTSNGRCGPGLGSCTNCCSAEGYCGTGPEYCISPDCQYEYGPLCDANFKPSGASTENVPRPLVGHIPYGGAGIYDCITPGTVAFTFDDGPYLYTNDVLDKFKRYNAKATFFITGNNLGKGQIDTTPAWSDVIKRMVSEGHQVASHTWTHQSLDKIDSQTFRNQIIYNEMAFRNILGYFPSYIRPPYSQCQEDTCGSKLRRLGYHVIYFDVDTAGYLNTNITQIQKSKDIWDATINAGNPSTSNFLEIEHDIHYQIAYNLTDHILESIYAKGYRSVTVGECLGDPAENWYRSGCNDNSGSCRTLQPPTSAPSVSSAPASAKVSKSRDGLCGYTTTCFNSTFGICCSENG
ncbi:Chitin deacetylase [Erysiphe neolycopersici]|uniref:Chitin deacetylase n=1 Tax=Erysiphe neolycopersici TaxID=212602 RepID=A0A420HU84_9PEZI|nr:Chitin deacetylase [Erysiphe neolycopersici]